MQPLIAIISPAKTFTNEEVISSISLPIFQTKADQLIQHLSTYSPKELAQLYRSNESIALTNYQRFQDWDAMQMSPALLCYNGLQFKAMQADVMTEAMWHYLTEHLRILSALYGVLRPFDAIKPYRLDFNCQLQLDSSSSLYDFWDEKVAQALSLDGGTLLNLASAEFSKLVLPYLDRSKVQVIDFDFYKYDVEKERYYQPATLAKQARGAMVRFLAEKEVSDPTELKAFQELGLSFDAERSSTTHYVHCTKS